MTNLLGINDFDKNQLVDLLRLAKEFKNQPTIPNHALNGKIVAMLFFEPSTRTRLSFESAVLRLGGQVIGFADAATSSTAKGESLEDTIKIVSGYADMIVMRHPETGAAQRAAAVSIVPIINAGDGSREHPTQTLLDIFTIADERSGRSSELNPDRLENLRVAFAGDLKFGRTVHSLSLGLRHFNPTYYFVSPPNLKLPDEFKKSFDEHRINYQEMTDFTQLPADINVLYMTRIQKERFDDIKEYEALKNMYQLNQVTSQLFNSDCLFMHPLPRVTEIDPQVDADPRAVYFKQARNGLFVRMAILTSIKY